MTTAESILKLLKEKCSLDKKTTILHEDNFFEEVVAPLEESDFDFDYDSGVTKGVILPIGRKYVIKIPFTGSSEEYHRAGYWTEDDEGEEYYKSGVYRDDYIDFGGADFQEDWDYCGVEAWLYKAAKNAGVEKVLCKTKYIGSVNNYPVYIQQRADVYFNNLEDDDSKKYTAKSTKEFMHSKNWRCFDSCWCRDVLNLYGEKFFERMMIFFKEYNILSDLHSRNYGYLNGRPVIIDYSSFNE